MRALELGGRPKGKCFCILTATGSDDSDNHMALCSSERVTRLVGHYVVNLGPFSINPMQLVAAHRIALPHGY